jgi:hypothetical protein
MGEETYGLFTSPIFMGKAVLMDKGMIGRACSMHEREVHTKLL